jgi:hypothetical protein
MTLTTDLNPDPNEAQPDDLKKDPGGELQQFERNLLLTVQACWRLQVATDNLKAAADQLFV